MTKCFLGYPKEVNGTGRCCCNCKFQVYITSHPWNKNQYVKGPVNNLIGWGCNCPESSNTITFMDREHSLCEMHEFKEVKEKRNE